ncbi:MAG TPA: hypothetical protein VKA97_06805, partial [Pyrinomonadaceae bacterium]|nr:hypothetical protein [Pyrinomonadaceae bacterium]
REWSHSNTFKIGRYLLFSGFGPRDDFVEIEAQNIGAQRFSIWNSFLRNHLVDRARFPRWSPQKRPCVVT